MSTIRHPLSKEMNIIEISQNEKTPYFYMLIDYGTCYLCLRSNRRDYTLDIVRQIDKDEISTEDAAPLLEEGDKFFKHVDSKIAKYLEKYGIE